MINMTIPRFALKCIARQKELKDNIHNKHNRTKRHYILPENN